MQPSEKAPIERIFNKNWVYAVGDGARAIRIRPTSKGTQICYQIGDQWLQQMMIPAYVHGPLLRQVDSMCRDGNIDLFLRDRNFNVGIDWRLRVEKTGTAPDETLLLSFEKPQIQHHPNDDWADNVIG